MRFLIFYKTNLKRAVVIFFLIIFFQIKTGRAQDLNDSLSVYPNPFCNELNIQYTLSGNDTVSLYVVNILGQQEHVFFYDWKQTAASYTIQYNADSLKPGVYFIRLEYGLNKSIIKKILKGCDTNLQPSETISDSINIYPNPVESKIYIGTSGMMTRQIEIVDVAGRIVKHLNSETQNSLMKLDLSSLIRGMYFINIKMMDGTLKVYKFLKA